MLKLMRENLKHLTWVLGLVVLAFVFSVFADYGGQGSWFGGSGGNWAAKVNGEEIPVQEFLRAARNVDGYYRRLLGESYDRARFNLNIGQQAVQQLVQDRVVLSHARSLGLSATPAEIRDALVTDPRLQGEDGFIGLERYKEVLRRQGLDPASFEQEIAEQVLRRKWVELVTADIVATDRQVAEEIRRRDERADVAFVQFRPAELDDDIEISDEELAAYYEENGEVYARGEGRSFQLLTFDRLREQREITVPEEELRAEYDAALETRFMVPEQRRASHILVKTPPEMTGDDIAEARARAQAALDRVRAGEDFATVAQEVSEDNSAANGGDLGFFGRGIMTPPFENAVWQLAEIGDVADELVRTEFGFHIVKLTGKQEARRKPFEEVREELQRELAFRRAGDRVRDAAQSFYDDVSVNPDAFEATAARQSRVVTDSGPLYPGDPVPGIGTNEEVERALFALSVGEISAPIAVPRGHLIARFRETHSGGIPPLEEIRDRVESDLRNDRATRKADELARQVLERAAGGGQDLAALGEELGFQVEEIDQAARGSALGSLGIVPEIERAVFEAPVGEITGPIETGRGPVVLQVKDRVEVTDEQLAARAPLIREQLTENRRQLAVQALTRELVEAADVRTNDQVIQAIDAPERAAASG